MKAVTRLLALAFVVGCTLVSIRGEGEEAIRRATVAPQESTVPVTSSRDLTVANRSIRRDLPLPEAIFGIVWRLARIDLGDGRAVIVDHPERYTVAFMDSTRLSLRVYCNTGFLEYEGRYGEFIARSGSTTLIGCPDDGSLSDTFMGGLGRSSSYELVGDRLVFRMSGGRGGLTFIREPEGL